jgi:hypothetical protein
MIYCSIFVYLIGRLLDHERLLIADIALYHFLKQQQCLSTQAP